MRGFLTRLPIDDPIAQRNATHMIQVLGAFPQMMVRRAIFSPFIHPNWHRADGPEVRKALPEPLGNCMGIAHMFASRTPDTRAFVWNAIRTEQRRLMDQVSPLLPCWQRLDTNIDEIHLVQIIRAGGLACLHTMLYYLYNYAGSR